MSLRRAAPFLVVMALGACASSPVLRADEIAAKELVPDVVTKVYMVADLVLPLSPSIDSQSGPDFESLIDLIELRTGADCWTDGGGLGSISPHVETLSLVVRQTRTVHEQMADLLDEIRGTGDLALAVEMQLIRGDLNACDGSKTNRTAQGLVDTAGKHRLLSLLQSQKDGQILSATKIRFFNGQTGSIETVAEGKPTTIAIRGVVSKDNRYSRLWIDSKIDGESASAEVLVPEGHTAVRKLAGENSWLLVTSHVINAEEPQVIAPQKLSPAPAIEQKRFLVPVDETPDPTELTSLPQFKAQAEGFGDSIASRVTQIAVIEVCEATAGNENACLATADKPVLAPAIENLEYQVAMAEPGDSTKCEFESAGRVSVQLNLVPVERATLHAGPANGLFTGFSCLSATENCAPGVVHCFSNNSEVQDPPARLDVCLEESDCQASTHSPVQFGQLFERVFAQPAPKTFPLPPHAVPKPSKEITVFSRRYSDGRGHAVEVPNPGFGHRAILSSPKAYPHGEYGVIVEQHALPWPSAISSWSPARPDLLYVVPAPAPSPATSRVQQVSGRSDEPTNVTTHLRKAVEELSALGLQAEAGVIREVMQSLARKAQERSFQIDLEIARLKAEQCKLQLLSAPTVGHAGGTTN